MKKTRLFTTAALSTITLPLIASASSVPEGFQDFFQQQKRDVEIKGIDGTFFSVPMLVTYDSVRLEDPKDARGFITHLVLSGLSEDAAREIVSTLQHGQSNSVNCIGDLNLCSLAPQTFDTFYDYHSNKLYLYVNKEMLEDNKPKAIQKNYAATYNENAGIINDASLYTSSDLSDNTTVSLSDQLIWGLPYGSIHIDSYVSNQEDASELNYGYYNLEYKAVRMTSGYHQDRLALNSTSFLLNGTQYHDLNASLSSSKNLSRTNKKDEQFLFYYAPSPGVLKVYKDDQIIVQRSVGEGQGSLRYSELPHGVYDVVIEISTGNQVVSSESARIYNANTDTLNTGEFDYLLSAGQFQGNETTQLNPNSTTELAQSFDDTPYVQGLVAYKWSDAHTVAIGSTITDNYVMNQIGFKGYLPFDSRYEVSLSSIDSEAFYVSGYWNIDSIGITYEKLTNDERNLFAEYLYGATSKEQLSISSSFALGADIRGYGSVNYLNQIDFYENELTNWFISSGLSMPFILNSSLDLNLSFSNEELVSNWDQGEATIALNWSVPLSSILRGNAGVTFDEDGFSQYTNSLESRDLVKRDDTDLRVTLSNSYSQNSPDTTLNSLTTYGSQHNRHYQADGFAYIADNGERSFNATLSSTQVVGKNSLNFTTQHSDAFVAVDTKDNIRFDKDEEQTKGLLVIRSNDKFNRKEYINNESALIPLGEYQASTVELDVESVALHNSGQQSVTAYTHPGTVVELNSNVSRVISFVSKFKDIFGNNIEEVKCSGPACLEISNITSGIHKIDVQEGLSFTLTSDGQQCYLPSVDDAKQLNFGTNYCQPDLSPMESIVLVKNNREINVMYIGEFDDLAMIKPQLQAMTDQGMEILSTQLGRKSFVYLTGETGLQLTQQQQQDIENVARYASSETPREQDFVLNRPEGN